VKVVNVVATREAMLDARLAARGLQTNLAKIAQANAAMAAELSCSLAPS
jgi:hypothetical protein